MASKHQTALVKYAVLVGLTPLIPLPFLDDLAQQHFERRLIARLLREHQIPPDDDHASALAAPLPSPHGAVLGCLLTLVLYPLKKLFRKLFFFLEIKRAIDLVSTTYSLGYALDHVLGAGLYVPGGPLAPVELRGALERALARVGTSPIEMAVRSALVASRGALQAAADALLALLKGVASRRPSEAQIRDAVRPLEEASGPLDSVNASVERSLLGVPRAHFARLEAAIEGELRVEKH
jgi:hypothetical protein